MLVGALGACGEDSAKQPAPKEPVAASAGEQSVSFPRAEIVEFCREAQLRHPNDANAQLLLINQFAASTSEPQRVAELCTTYAQGAADAAQELAQDIERQRAKRK
jgi:hypothetical protein